MLHFQKSSTATLMIYGFDLTQIISSFLSFSRDATETSVCKPEKAKYGEGEMQERDGRDEACLSYDPGVAVATAPSSQMKVCQEHRQVRKKKEKCVRASLSCVF